ncbi:MAG: YggT family protein [Chloroflexi bacterium]|nr:YggT family protein [Chloroflexota bacterium]
MAFLINFFDLLFTLLGFAIIARALVSWLPIDRYHPAIRILDQITEPILAPLRRVIPPLGGMMDITPIIALILIQIVQALVHNVLVSAYYG